MKNFIIRYRVIEKYINESKRVKYISSVLIKANTKEEAEKIVIDSYEDTLEINYEIIIL